MATADDSNLVTSPGTPGAVGINRLKSMLKRASMFTETFHGGDVNADMELKFALRDLAVTLEDVLEPRDLSGIFDCEATFTPFDKNFISPLANIESERTQSECSSFAESEKSMMSGCSEYTQPPSEAECEYPPLPEHCLEKFEHLKAFGETSFGSDYSVYSVPPSEADCEYPPLAEHCLQKFDFLNEAPDVKSFGSDYSVYSVPPSEADCEYPPPAEHCLRKFDFLKVNDDTGALGDLPAKSLGELKTSVYCLEELEHSCTSSSDFFLPSYFASKSLTEFRCLCSHYPAHLLDLQV